jgi:hypothetical protein
MHPACAGTVAAHRQVFRQCAAHHIHVHPTHIHVAHVHSGRRGVFNVYFAFFCGISHHHFMMFGSVAGIYFFLR